MVARKNTEIDFWKKVDKTSNPNGCWVWTGKIRNKDGYGSFIINHKTWSAHRFTMLIAGQDPIGWEVMHRCDNPPCINPAHLSLGTHKDNMQDMINKGRHPTCGKLLNDNLVLDIRQEKLNGASGISLSKKYNVSPTTISRICRRIIWTHI